MLTLGILFILNAIFGRYIVLPGYLESLESGSSYGGGVAQDATGWQIARYLIWAYSFKFGIFFIIIGVLLRTNIKLRRIWLYAAGGVVYLALAYIDIPGYHKLLFGIGGGIMSVLIVWILWLLAREHRENQKTGELSTELRIAGYFFLAMATYNMCPLLGIKGFALQPEKMIEYGLQAQAVSFASHVLIELVLGWVFIFLSHLSKRTGATIRTEQES
jgi:hypothetical protein